MFDKINQVQRQYTYAVQPVKLFETENSQAAQKSSFDFFNKQTNSSAYSLLHPDVSNTLSGSKLDLMG